MQDLVQQCAQRLRDRGLRVTEERRAVLNWILGHPRHFDSESLVAELNRAGVPVSRATVYRTLGHLVSAGLLRRYELGDRQSLYEVAVGREHHEHLICTQCGKIIEFVHEEIERLQGEVCRQFDFRASSHTLQIRGLCAMCDVESSVGDAADSSRDASSPTTGDAERESGRGRHA